MINNSDFFLVSKTKPLLIENHVLNKVIKDNTIPNQNKEFIKKLIYEFIKNNIYYVSIITIIILFLLYRYFTYHSIKKRRRKRAVNITNTDAILKFFN
jgi:hypothetical protein